MFALGGLFRGRRQRGIRLIRAVQKVYVGELTAGGDEALRSFLFAHAEHIDFGLA